LIISKEEFKNNYDIFRDKIEKHYTGFVNLDEERYFDEFMFCLLTPQSNAQRCWEAVKELRNIKGEINEQKVVEILKTKTRFHNTKAKRIVMAEKGWEEVKEIIKEKTGKELRDELAKQVNGYGLKEASHFTRNIGLSKGEVAILDRHILRNLKEIGIIEEEKIKGKSDYLRIEKIFIDFSKEVGIDLDHLDLYFWSKENGELFK